MTIGDIHFQYGDPTENITKERALRIFEDILDLFENNYKAANAATARYGIQLSRPALFYLIVDYLNVGGVISNCFTNTGDDEG